jgi:hypothetical protein
MARKFEEHNREHAKAALQLASFYHPACEALSDQQKSQCPLSPIQWESGRKMAQGVELRSRAPQVQADRLRWQLLCHIALGKVMPEGEHDGCPLHLEGVQVVTRREGESLILQIITKYPSQVPELQRRMQQLVSLSGR